MNKLQLWQHPFVDLFKYVHLSDWSLAHKEGDVSESLDKLLGKRVYSITGSVSAANFIQIPKAKTALKALGLTGKFVYFQVVVPAGKLFAFHLDFSVSNQKTKMEEVLRVSISNIFRGGKQTSGIQLACTLGTKWTVLCVDLGEVLRIGGMEHLQNQSLRSLTICANVTVRGVYTSDILYTPKTLPKEMALKVKNIEDWPDYYDWLTLPTPPGNENIDSQPQSVPARTIKSAPTKTQRPAPAATRSTPRIPMKKPSKPMKAVSNPPPPQSQDPIPATPPVSDPVSPEVIIDEFDDRDSMEPDPLLRLRSVMGFTPVKSGIHWLPGGLFETYPEEFTKGGTDFLLCSSGPSLLLLNPRTGRQHVLFGHLQPIDFIRRAEGGVLVTGQTTPPLLFLWNLIAKHAPIPIHPYKLEKITAIDISFSGKTIVVAGTDSYGRFSLQILDVGKVGKGRAPVVIAKQLSDFTINDVRFEPLAEERVVTVGKGSVRFWKVKNEHLPGKSVSFPDIGRKDDFLCLDFRDLQTAVIGSCDGYLFLIPLKSKEITAVYQLHAGPILSLRVGQSFCVTAGGDCAVRLWPASFGECELDLAMSAGVVAVDISDDGNKLGIGAVNCSMGVMDLEKSEFTTLLRAHAGRVVGVDIHQKLGIVVTAGEDRTIRVWSDVTLSQTHEFTSDHDDPLCPRFHPVSSSFVCGFSSGFLRVFDIDSASTTNEIQQFKARAEICQYDKDAKWLLAVCEDGTWSLLDVVRAYQPVKSQTLDHPPPHRAAAFAPDGTYFIVLGANGNSICLWDCQSLTMKAKFMTGGNSIRSLQFDHTGRDLIVVTNAVPGKLHVYEVNGYKLGLAREFGELHTGCVSAVVSSRNNRYLITTGDDKVIRIWDYSMQGDGSRCQAFIAHTSLTELMLLTPSCDLLITSSKNDGLFVWDFKGIKGKIRPPKPPFEEVKEDTEKEDGEFKMEQRDECQPVKEEDVQELIDMAETVKPESVVVPSSQQLALSEQSAISSIGFTPSSLLWDPYNGRLFHTIGTNVSLTELKEPTRQRLLIRHLDPVACIALSPNKGVLATAVGRARLEGFADIVLWDAEAGRELKTLSYHDQGVCDIDFSPCSNYLVSVGNAGESVICVWEVSSGSLLSTSLSSSLVHSIVFDQCSLNLEFAVIGDDSAAFWRINKYRKLEFQHIDVPQDTGKLLSVSYTLSPTSETLLLIGTSQGCLICIDSRSNCLLKVLRLIQDEISVLRCSETRVVLGGTGPNLYSWKVGLMENQPEMLLLDGSIAALSIPREGEEGVVGTSNGTIWYINWTERATIKIHSSHPLPVRTLAVQGDVLVSGSEDKTLRTWNLNTFEPISQFSLPNSACLCLHFHPSSPYLISGFSDGYLRVFDIQSCSSLGKCRVYSSQLTAVCVAADGGCVIAGSETGILTAVFVENWVPFRVRLFEFGMAGAGVEQVHQGYQGKCILAATTAGRVNVWERKPIFDRETFPRQAEDQKLFTDERSEFNLIDVLDMVMNATELHPDQLTQIDTTQQASVDVHAGADFSQKDSDCYLAFVSALPCVFMRNYREHTTIKKIQIGHYITTLSLDLNGEIIVGTGDRLILILREDRMTETLVGHSDSVSNVVIGTDCIVSCAGTEVIKWRPPALR